MVAEQSELSSFQRSFKLVSVASVLTMGVLCVATTGPTTQLLIPHLQGTSIPTPHEISEMEHRDLKKKGRIVGGQESKKGQFPFMISLRNGDPEWSWATCGGSLISPSIILTAGHCAGTVTIADYNRYDQGDNPDTAGIQRRMIEKSDIITHEKYSHTTLDYDYALIRLSKPIKNPAVIRLNEDPNFPGKKAQKQRVIGWGRTEYKGNPSQIQKYADLDYVEQEECLRRFNNNYITDQMMCAYSDGEDSCQGDSGGPLVSMNSQGDSVQVGVVSWGSGCAGKYPGVYSRVHRIVDWINEKVCQGSDALAPQDCKGNVIGDLSGGSSGTGDSSNADDISGTDGEAKEKERSSASSSSSTCRDEESFSASRSKRKLTCDYVKKSKRTRCRIYKDHCPKTCGECSE